MKSIHSLSTPGRELYDLSRLHNSASNFATNLFAIRKDKQLLEQRHTKPESQRTSGDCVISSGPVWSIHQVVGGGQYISHLLLKTVAKAWKMKHNRIILKLVQLWKGSKQVVGEGVHKGNEQGCKNNLMRCDGQPTHAAAAAKKGKHGFS